MTNILARKRADGTTSYTAQIRLKRNGKIIVSEAKTFSRMNLAEKWRIRRLAELEHMRATGVQPSKGVTLETLINDYIESADGITPWGRSKKADIERLKACNLAERDVTTLTVSDYMDYIRERRISGAGPATALNDLVWLRQVFLHAAAKRGLADVLTTFDVARQEMIRTRIVAKPMERERRLKPEEEKLLLEHFSHRDCRSEIPMLDVMLFALASARRQSEICQIRRSMTDLKNGLGWLDDVKHPRQKTGNRRQFKMTKEAAEILERQPVVKNDKTKDGRDLSDLFFPYNSKSISAAFTRACKFLKIEDLHFHDLRHEGTSRLFERGYQIQEVAHFTLHESWETLKRYTHLLSNK